MAAVCLACTVGDDVIEFPTMLELKAHEMTGHTTRWEKALPTDPRGDHPSATELKQKGKPKTAQTQEAQPTEPEPEKLTPPQPLVLKYKWEGQCPQCRNPIKTIEVEVDQHALIVAYCVGCDKKLAQGKVRPLVDGGGYDNPKGVNDSDNDNFGFAEHLVGTKKSKQRLER